VELADPPAGRTCPAGDQRRRPPSVRRTVRLDRRNGNDRADAILLGVLLLENLLEGHVYQPLIMGRTVGLRPVVVLVALTLGGVLGGIMAPLPRSQWRRRRPRPGTSPAWRTSMGIRWSTKSGWLQSGRRR
jgi:hypothetical protein